MEENSSAPRLESFCSSASGQLRDVDERLTLTDSKFKATAERFGEKQVESHDFFKMFAEFFAALNEAKAENEKREQERRDAARQEKLKIDRQERISRTASKVKPKPKTKNRLCVNQYPNHFDKQLLLLIYRNNNKFFTQINLCKT